MTVNKVIYLVFILGVILSQMQLLRDAYLGIRNRISLHRDMRHLTSSEGNQPYGRAMTHIMTLMKATKTDMLIGKPEYFVAVSLIIGIGITFSLRWAEGLKFALIVGMLSSLLPYFIMRIRLSSRRIGSSREGDIMVRELLNNYKINDCNMKEAIEATAASIEDAPNSKSLLYDLAKGFNNAYTREDIEKVLKLFKYSLNTAWGNALATTIYFSQVHGTKVTEALEDLAESLVRSRQVIEHGRRENNEAALMLKYLAPLSYIMSVFCACRYFGFSLSKFIQYQFATPLGLKWFIIMIVLFIGGIMVNAVLSREKMDI